MPGIHKKKWLLAVLTTVLVLLVGAAIFVGYRYNNPKTILYTEQYTYTMKDDQEVYLSRIPQVYVESLIPNVRFYPKSLHEVFARLTDDSMQHWADLTRRYNFHLNLDYALEQEAGQLTVTYMGFGKLRDGTVEAIDIKDTYLLFRYEDHTSGAWDAPTPSEVIRITEWQDPAHVIDPQWPEDSAE